MTRFTPKQLAAAVELASARKKREMAEALSLHAQAAQGDPKRINQRIKDLSRK